MHVGSRSILDREIQQLREHIAQLGSIVVTAIDDAMLALGQRDVQLAQQVVANDEAINHLRHEVEQLALMTLATQQPAATDLRTIIAAIHLAVELERMGDHASGVARLVRRLESEDEIDSLHKLPKMARRARQMVEEGVQAFMQRDAALARSLTTRDRKMDKHYRKLYRETLEEMRDEAYIRRATFLLWVGHNLERIGDRACNIAERVVFMVTAEFTENIDEFDDDDLLGL